MPDSISIGAAYRDQAIVGGSLDNTPIGNTTRSTSKVTSLNATGGITSSGPTGVGIGYATGAGGTATQGTDRVTGVTVDKLSGTITTHNASLAVEVSARFTVTNSTVAIGDCVILTQRSGAVGVMTNVWVDSVAAGSFVIVVGNGNAAGGVAETGAIIINFCVIKAVSA